jgi:hypothetical protein
MILQISAYQVARVIGVNRWHLVPRSLFYSFFLAKSREQQAREHESTIITFFTVLSRMQTVVAMLAFML